MQACKPKPGLDWTPEFFSLEQSHTIAALVDHLLPKTNTPGALELGVDRFVDLMLRQQYGAEDQKKFLSGLTDFEADCLQANGHNFSSCSAAEKNTLLQKYEAASAPIPPNVWGGQIGEFAEPHFYRKLKALTLLGYFSSEEIGEEVLNYDPIPGRWNGCIPLSEVKNGYSWAL